MADEIASYMQGIDAVFPKDITARIEQAVQQYPDLGPLFQDIARHEQAPASQNASANSKKRKLDHSVPYTNGAAPATITTPRTTFECKDVSFQVPARKKLKLQLVADAQDGRRQEVRLQNQQSNDIEHTIPADQIDQIFCLPVPEKQQRQWNFVVFPKLGATTSEGTPCEQMVFTMSETKPTGATSAEHTITEQDTLVTVTELELNRLLQPQGKHVIIPNASEFASSIPQPHRKGEKAYHVKAFRGSKDGYLFFLPLGIVFAFKKPLAFFPFAAIESISYTSVLQRTFNLSISARESASEDAEVKEVEFSMLDQADFAGIDEYIKRHGLNDASMAAQRRAKAYNTNKEKKGEVTGGGEGDTAMNGGAVDEDGRTELQKAEQMLQDEEDDEEEDYVASGGESEGEGDESDGGDEDAEGEVEYDDEGEEEGAEETAQGGDDDE